MTKTSLYLSACLMLILTPYLKAADLSRTTPNGESNCIEDCQNKTGKDKIEDGSKEVSCAQVCGLANAPKNTPPQISTEPHSHTDTSSEEAVIPPILTLEEPKLPTRPVITH